MNTRSASSGSQGGEGKTGTAVGTIAHLHVELWSRASHSCPAGLETHGSRSNNLGVFSWLSKV